MTFLLKNPVLHKAWYFLRTYVLTLKRFDLFLQGSLLIVILLETNLLLLLRRNDGGGYTPTALEDWVMVGSSGAEFLLGSLLAWFGRNRRNLALSTALAAASVSALLVLAEPFVGSNYPHVELCGGDAVLTRSVSLDSYSPTREVLLIISVVLCTFAKVSVWAHGLTYLDDHQPENGPYFYGILISIRLSLGLSGWNWLQDASLAKDWWKGHVSIASLTFMFAVLFTFFPKQMVQFPEDDRPVNTDYLGSLKRVLRNKLFVLQTSSLAMLSTAVFGFVHYDRAYVQAKFHVEAYRNDPQTSRGLSDIFRSLVIIFFVMIFRIRFSCRRADGVKASTACRVGGVVAAVAAVLLAVIAALGCDTSPLQGMHGHYQQPACSQGCGCESQKYGFSPVCGVDTHTSYFSPCNAGCSQFESLNGFLIFSNCSCGMERAVRGACSVSGCRVPFSAYQVLYTVMLATSASSFLMQGMVILRTVRRVDKPVAVGTSFAVVALLSFVIGHLVYMTISYMTCAYPNGYVCALHHETLWALVAVSSALAAASAGVSLYASTARPEPEPTTEL